MLNANLLKEESKSASGAAELNNRFPVDYGISYT